MGNVARCIYWLTGYVVALNETIGVVPRMFRPREYQHFFVLCNVRFVFPAYGSYNGAVRDAAGLPVRQQDLILWDYE